jgi:hypothetical protein
VIWPGSVGTTRSILAYREIFQTLTAGAEKMQLPCERAFPIPHAQLSAQKERVDPDRPPPVTARNTPPRSTRNEASHAVKRQGVYR